MPIKSLKGILISSNGCLYLSQDEVFKLSRELTIQQIESILNEGESILVKAVDMKDLWQEYWIGI